MALLETKDLCKYYGSGATEVRALDGVTMRVDRGEFVAIVGTSGSGKSVRRRAVWWWTGSPSLTSRMRR